MHPVIRQCPVCADTLSVTRLHCHSCDTTIEGRFELGRLAELQPGQLRFVELFMRCEGKINRVCQELNLSYPVVRAQLTEVIEAMGFEPEPPEPVVLSTDERKEVLAKVASGEISADEAVELLKGN